MIDLVIHAPDRLALRNWARTHNLFRQTDDGPAPIDGLDYCWWGGDGQFMTKAPVVGEDGNITSPPNYLSGVVALLRISTPDDAISEGDEQWQRSKVAKYIRNNGSLTTFGGLPCVVLDNCRLFRAADVFQFCADRGLPSHQFLGGNSI